VLPLQSLSNAAAALKGETVDAALLPISTARALVDSGGAKFLGWVGDETPWQLGAVFASPKTLANAALVTKLAGRAGARRPRISRRHPGVREGWQGWDHRQDKTATRDHRQIHQPAGRAGGRQLRLYRSRRQARRQERRNQISWLQEQGFVDKGFAADAIIAKEYVKAD
jgi:hypothetical protein